VAYPHPAPAGYRPIPALVGGRRLGETAGNFRNADRSEGSRITCSLSDTTEVFHQQSLMFSPRHLRFRSNTV
jgi:hypothetical protein